MNGFWHIILGYYGGGQAVVEHAIRTRTVRLYMQPATTAQLNIQTGETIGLTTQTAVTQKLHCESQ